MSKFNSNQIIRQQKLYARISFQVQVILEERFYVAYMGSGKQVTACSSNVEGGCMFQ